MLLDCSVPHGLLPYGNRVTGISARCVTRCCKRYEKSCLPPLHLIKERITPYPNFILAPDYVLNQLILKGMNRTFDALTSEYDFKDYAFSKLRERYKVWAGNSMEDKLFDSFDIRDNHGKLTNAGALLADDSPIMLRLGN